jgi:hypothetical protein
MGLIDMLYALQYNKPHRANGELAYHVLDVMQAIHEAPVEGKHMPVESSCERPTPLPLGANHHTPGDYGYGNTSLQEASSHREM